MPASNPLRCRPVNSSGAQSACYDEDETVEQFKGIILVTEDWHTCQTIMKVNIATCVQ